MYHYSGAITNNMSTIYSCLTVHDLRVTSTWAALLLLACNMTTGLPAPLLHHLYPVSGEAESVAPDSKSTTVHGW